MLSVTTTIEQRARFIEREQRKGPIAAYTHCDDSYSKYVDGGHVPSWWNNKLLTEFYHSTGGELCMQIRHGVGTGASFHRQLEPVEAIKNFDCQLGL